MLPKSTRLKFERLTYDHFEDFFELDSDPEVMKFIRRPAITREDALHSLEKYIRYNEKHPQYGAFSIYMKETNEHIGLGVIMHVELRSEHGKIEVGYSLKKKHWGNGFATEIGLALLKYGFHELNLPELYGTTHPEHFVSQKVLLKMGMNDIGRMPLRGDSKIFRIIKDDFKNQ